MELELNLRELKPFILVVENPSVFSDMVENFWKQINGLEGKWILSDQDKILKIDKKLDFIINPFSVSSNDKKILNKIYSEIIEDSQENMFDETVKLNSLIVEYLDQICQSIIFPLDYELDLNLVGLLKLYNVKIEEECNSLLERLVSYIRLKHQICSVEIFVFVNLKQYFSELELVQLYQSCNYEHVYLLDLESYQKNDRILSEQYLIIDQDLCLIQFD